MHRGILRGFERGMPALPTIGPAGGGEDRALALLGVGRGYRPIQVRKNAAMYEFHWGLRRPPFGTGIDPTRFYPSVTHREGLARMHFLVEQGHRVGLLLGEAGMGKSLLLEVLAAELRRERIPVAHVSALGLEPREFLERLLQALAVRPSPSDAAEGALWRALADRLIEHRYQQLPTVILVDDADQARFPLRERILRLAKFEPALGARLTLVLAGRYHRIDRLGLDLLDLAWLRIDLEPWGLPETIAFVQTSLEQAGASPTVFEEEALARLHALAGGIPRRIIHLADLALAAGAGEKLASIGARTLETACRELGLVEV